MITPGLMWLALLLLVAAYELWAMRTGHPTLSQWVWWFQASHRWFAFVVIAAMTMLMAHFFIR